MAQSLSTPSGEFWAGARAIIPLTIGVLPFGIVFGAAAIAAGIDPAATFGFSAIVFAGSAQFVGVGLITQGASPWVIILTTFIVNARHALYSASLGPYVRDLPQYWLVPLGFFLTDEAYATVIARYRNGPQSANLHWYYFGAAFTLYLCWQIWTLLGIVAGQSIPAEDWGLDFALVVTFIGIVAPLLKNRPTLLAAAVAGIVSILAHGMPLGLGLLVAAISGIATGYIAEIVWQPGTSPMTGAG